MSDIEVYSSVGGPALATLVECPECFAIVTWRNVPLHADWHDNEQQQIDFEDLKAEVRDLVDSLSDTDRTVDDLQRGLSDLEEALKALQEQVK